MTESDGRGAQQGPVGGPPTTRRFGGDGPTWPSLRETPGAAPAAPAAPVSAPLSPVLPSAELPTPTGAWPVTAPAGTSTPPRGSHAADPATPTGPVRRSSRRDDDRRPATGAHAAVPPAATPTAPVWGAATAPVPPVAAPAPAAPVAAPPALAPATASAATTDAGTQQEPPRRSRRTLYLVIAGVVVLVAAGVTAFFLTRGDGTTPAQPADVVLPSPTATVAPAARTATTPFASALPTTVLQYALASSEDDSTWLARNALEAYAETYTDGAGTTVTVQAGQWETAEEATTVRTALAAELPTAAGTGSADATTSTATTGGPAVLEQGDVLVGGAPTGTVTVVDAGDGTGIALWSNGTTVFRVTGPVADIENLYAAYPL
jgi:hypothetical protein